MQPNPHAIDVPSPVDPAGALVVTVDRLPAWMLAAYGATWMATPTIDGLAARGVTFDRVIAPSLAPDAVHGLPGGIGTDVVRLMVAAAARGWRPIFVTDDAAVAAGFAAEASLAEVEVRQVEAVADQTVMAEDSQTIIGRLVDTAAEVIASGGRRLVWCHFGGLGVAWDAPEAYRERYVDPEDPPPPAGACVPGFAVGTDTDPDAVVGVRQVFAGQVTLLDSQLGRLLAAVRERESAVGPWAVLVIGLRGLSLGLHGWVGVGGPSTPFGELVHVPGILVDAGGRMAAQRHGGLVVPADLVGTLVEMVETLPPIVEMPRKFADGGSGPPWKGVSLATLFEDWSAPIRDRVVVVEDGSAAVVTRDWFGVLGGGGEWFRLFAKPDDYFEQSDVAARCHEAAERLAAVARLALAGECARGWLAELPPDP